MDIILAPVSTGTNDINKLFIEKLTKILQE